MKIDKRVRFYDSPEVRKRIKEIIGSVKYYAREGEVKFYCDNGEIAYEGDWICWNEYGSFVMKDESFE